MLTRTALCLFGLYMVACDYNPTSVEVTFGSEDPEFLERSRWRAFSGDRSRDLPVVEMSTSDSGFQVIVALEPGLCYANSWIVADDPDTPELEPVSFHLTTETCSELGAETSLIPKVGSAYTGSCYCGAFRTKYCYNFYAQRYYISCTRYTDPNCGC